jgi:uncharacterized protein (TIGR02646 family)
MIRVRRSSPPHHLTRWAEKWTAKLLDAIRLCENGNSGPPTDSLWNKYSKPYVKRALQEMFHDKCAYCESKITHVSYPHIEHYRPKRQYPHLTFCWENFLLACGMCNGPTYKGDRFPLQDEDDNKPLLLNPCDDDPAPHIRFEQARVVPLSERGYITRELLGLNRDELFERRRERYISAFAIRLLIEQFEANGDTANAQAWHTEIERMTSAEAEYAAMVRQFMAEPLPEHPPL